MRKPQRFLLPAVPAVLLAGCSGPLSTLDPAGPSADVAAGLWWTMLVGSGVLTLMIVVLVAMGFRGPRPVREGRWTLAMGVGFSLAVLGSLLAAGIRAGERLLPHPDGVPEVRAHAWQWGWSFAHPDGAGGEIESIGALHIPAGRPVDVVVVSSDVIHSFWVPRLAGKIDAVPGRENRLRIESAEPGTYDGQCAEFCGAGHAGMRFVVIAHAAENWPAVLVTLQEGAGQ